MKKITFTVRRLRKHLQDFKGNRMVIFIAEDEGGKSWTINEVREDETFVRLISK